MTQPMNWSELDRKAIGKQLERILSSEIFKQSQRRRRFLTYIVGEALAGRAERLKGYTVALEVFRHDPHHLTLSSTQLSEWKLGAFATNSGTITSSIGRFDPIVVELPRGAYEPKFEIRREPLDRSDREGLGAHRSGSPLGLDELRLSKTSHRRLDGTSSPEARDALLRGLSAFWQYSRQSCFEAQEHFSRAIKLDKGYAAAHTWLARALVFEHAMNWENGSRIRTRTCLRSLNRAVALDGQSPMAQAVLGWTLLYTRDGIGAVTATRRACTLEPNFPDGRLSWP